MTITCTGGSSLSRSSCHADADRARFMPVPVENAGTRCSDPVRSFPAKTWPFPPLCFPTLVEANAGSWSAASSLHQKREKRETSVSRASPGNACKALSKECSGFAGVYTGTRSMWAAASITLATGGPMGVVAQIPRYGLEIAGRVKHRDIDLDGQSGSQTITWEHFGYGPEMILFQGRLDTGGGCIIIQGQFHGVLGVFRGEKWGGIMHQVNSTTWVLRWVYWGNCSGVVRGGR